MNSYASPLVVKYGGNALPGAESHDPLLDEIAEIARDEAVVLVHGGGPEIDRELARRNVPTERIDGLRVTDRATLDITEAVLCATVNKRLVRALQMRGADAAGISGIDGRLLTATIARGGALGFVGEISRIDPSLLRTLLAARYVPVIAPLGVSSDASALNVNADLAAAAIAVALDARALVFITNVSRVLRDPRDPSSAIEAMTTAQARCFHSSAGCSDGMRPKLEAAIVAASAGITVHIAGAGEGAVRAALAGDATSIYATAGSVARA